MTLLHACSLANPSACCAVLLRLDQRGCFCDTSKLILSSFDINLDEFTSLRDQCVPNLVRFTNCPRPTFTSCGSLSQEELLANRLRSLYMIQSIFSDHNDDFNLNQLYDDLSIYVPSDIILYVHDFGTFRGIDSFIEYFLVGLRTVPGTPLEFYQFLS